MRWQLPHHTQVPVPVVVGASHQLHLLTTNPAHRCRIVLVIHLEPSFLVGCCGRSVHAGRSLLLFADVVIAGQGVHHPSPINAVFAAEKDGAIVALHIVEERQHLICWDASGCPVVVVADCIP